MRSLTPRPRDVDASPPRLFLNVFTTLRSRWDIYPLNPTVFNRIKQVFVDWSVTSYGTRIKGHMSTRDRYIGSNERGNSIEWWMSEYSKKRHHAVAHDLTLQLEAEDRRRAKKEKEKERIRSGGCKYRREDLSTDLIRNCGKTSDLLEMVRCMDLTFTLTTDWRWKMLTNNEEGYSRSALENLKQKFIKRMLTVYLRPEVDAAVVAASNASIDFDVGVRCAVADLCGLPFWWRHEGVLRIIFESMAKPVEYTEFDDVR